MIPNHETNILTCSKLFNRCFYITCQLPRDASVKERSQLCIKQSSIALKKT